MFLLSIRFFCVILTKGLIALNLLSQHFGSIKENHFFFFFVYYMLFDELIVKSVSLREFLFYNLGTVPVNLKILIVPEAVDETRSDLSVLKWMLYTYFKRASGFQNFKVLYSLSNVLNEYSFYPVATSYTQII